jgi:hypothetical protein
MVKNSTKSVINQTLHGNYFFIFTLRNVQGLYSRSNTFGLIIHTLKYFQTRCYNISNQTVLFAR